MQFQKNKAHDPKSLMGWFFIPPILKNTKYLHNFFQNIGINILLYLLYNHDKTKKFVLPTSEGGEEQRQNGYVFHRKGGRGYKERHETHDRYTFYVNLLKAKIVLMQFPSEIVLKLRCHKKGPSEQHIKWHCSDRQRQRITAPNTQVWREV